MSWALEANAPPLPNRKPISQYIREAALMILAAALSGCAQPDGQGYARAIVDRPLPTKTDSIARECGFLNAEIMRQQSMAQAMPSQDLLPETAQAIQKATQTNIAALKSRAAQMSCPAPPDTLAAPVPGYTP
jgi:hypothetical protein